MPRKKIRGFEGEPYFRWVKMYQGVRYRIGCAELGLPESQWTEQGSYQTFDAWWTRKKAEIDHAPRALPPEVTEVIETLKRKKALLESVGQEADDYGHALQTAEATIEAGDLDLVVVDPRTKARAELLTTFGVDLSEVDPLVLEVALGSQDYWSEKFAAGSKVDADRRLGTVLDRWYDLLYKRAESSSISNLQGYIKEFKSLSHGKKAVLAAEMAVDCLTETKMIEVYQAFSAQAGKPGTKRKKFSTFKSFVGFCVESGLIAAPKNLRSKLLEFVVKTTSKPAPDPVVVRKFLDTLPDHLKLYALLALNTGSNNIDMGLMEHRQVNLEQRTLTKKRQKTEEWEGVPTVTYWLWDETVRLLRQEQDMTSEFVLTDARGECLYISTKRDGGKAKHYDKLKSQWRDHFGRSEAKQFTLMQFRFFGADILKESEFRSYRDAFLGHSPKSVADRHYASDENCTKPCQFLERIFYPQSTG